MWTDVMKLKVTELNSTSADILIGFYPINHGDVPFTATSLAHTFQPGGGAINGDIHIKADVAYSAFSFESRQFEMIIKNSLPICVYVCSLLSWGLHEILLYPINYGVQEFDVSIVYTFQSGDVP